MAYAGISATRLKTLDNMHLIEERVDRYGNRYYRTTPKGRREFEKRSGIKGYWSNSYVHDKGMYNVYVERSESEQRSWTSEQEQRRYAESQGIDLTDCSVADAAYTSDSGETFYVEIISSDYTDDMKAAKARYAEVMGGTYDPHTI